MWAIAATAIGVGGATAIGAVIGFFVGNIPDKGRDTIMGFAAGMMLAAASVGLIIPAVDRVGLTGIWQVVIGMVAGALFLYALDALLPHKHINEKVRKAELFAAAIAMHNLPEGLAAGVGFATGDIGGAVALSLGIALQNIPEGMIIIAPLVFAGVKRGKTLAIACATGLFEVVGTFIGYYAATASEVMLPFCLSFAGGMMLFVIADEMIPETHSGMNGTYSSFAMIFGFILMLIIDAAL